MSDIHDPSEWHRIEDLFSRATGLPDEERVEFLERECRGNAALLKEVLGLLEAAESSEDYFTDLAERAGAPPRREGPLGRTNMTLIGRTIGSFRVTDILGEGGMGEVYLGYDERLKRKVALKAIRGDKRFDEGNKTRLLREAEILSALEHPNICRIYDLLETEDADVLVLELIKGKTLHEVNVDELSPTEKLKIAIQLGEVLSDAHAHSVVHRDLKPENVMIDDRGDVKVLDFGLAHSSIDQKTITAIKSNLSSDALKSEQNPVEGGGDEGFRTGYGMVMGTPMYMSVEQARGENATAASDMYSFGLLLQWLFTGRPPYPGNMSQASLLLAASKGETSPADGAPDALKKLIERLKDIEPSRRPTATDTVEQLKRIEEAPRRKARKLAMVGAICILTVGVIISGYGLLQAKESERQERIARNRQEKLSSFLVDMWVAPSPMEQGRDVKVIDVLAYGREKVEEEFHDEPEIKVTLLNHLATTYRRLGDYEEAEALITECLDFSRSVLGPDHPRTISAMIEKGILLSYGERFLEADTLLRNALAAGEGNLEEDNDILVYAQIQYAENLIRSADYSEARVLLEDALTVIRSSEALKYKLAPKALLDLGNLLVEERDLAAAERVFLELIEEYEEIEDTENPNYIAAIGSAGRIFMEQGKHEMGLRYMRRGLDLSTRINGERHRTTLVSLINLGQAEADLGDYEAALVYTGRGLDLFKEVFGEKTPDTAYISSFFASLLTHVGRVEEAQSLLNEAVTLETELLGPEHPYTLSARYYLAFLLFETHRDVEAESLLRDVLATSLRTQGTDNILTSECKELLAQMLLRAGDLEEAERTLREVVEARSKAEGDKTSSFASTLYLLAECLYQQGKYEESSEHAERSLRSRFEIFGGDHPLTKEGVALLQQVFAASGRSDEADSLLRSLGLQGFVARL